MLAIASHDMNFVNAMMDNVYLLADGKVLEHFDTAQHESMPEQELARFMNGS